MNNPTSRPTFTLGLLLSIFLCAVGVVMEFFVGHPLLAFFAYPLNMLLGLLFLFVLFSVHLWGRSTAVYRFLSSLPVSLAVIVWMLYLAVLIGLIPQGAPREGALPLLQRLGFDRITTSWYFLLHCALFLFVLGLVTLRRLSSFSVKNVAFILNHAGLFVALLGGILGAADRQEFRMVMPRGMEVDYGISTDGKEIHTPFSLRLHEFSLERYPERAAMITPGRQALPTDESEMVTFEEVGAKYPLDDVLIIYKRRIANAVPDSLRGFVPTTERGGAIVLQLEVADKAGKKLGEGWLSMGNATIRPRGVNLCDGRIIIPIESMPRSFSSDLWVKQNGDSVRHTVSVNKPLSIDGYELYQSFYDQYLGRWSDYSGLLVAYDPWLRVVYVGLVMWLLGTVMMWWIGAKHSSSSVVDRGDNEVPAETLLKEGSSIVDDESSPVAQP